jgi:PST family polysaccharide transporter
MAPLAALAFGEPRVTLLMIVIAVTVPIGALGAVQTSLLTRHMKFKVIVAIELASAIVGTAVTIATAWIGWSYWSLAAGSIVLSIAAAVMSWFASDWRPSRPRYAATLKSDVGFGANVTGYNLATFLTTSGDNIIIGMLNGEKALGLYDRSFRLVVAPVSQAIAPIGRVAVPLLSRLIEDAHEYRRVFLVAVQMIILITVPGMLVCVLHGPEVVQVLLGPRWVEAGEILSWISVGGLASGLHSTALWLFVSQGRMRGLRQMTIIGAVLNLASFGIGSLWGIRGVAIGAGVVFALVTTPLIMFGATRRGPIPPMALLLACAPFIGAGVVSAILLRALQSAVQFSDIVQIFVALVVAYAVFGMAALATAEQRRGVFAVMRMLKRPKA